MGFEIVLGQHFPDFYWLNWFLIPLFRFVRFQSRSKVVKYSNGRGRHSYWIELELRLMAYVRMIEVLESRHKAFTCVSCCVTKNKLAVAMLSSVCYINLFKTK